MNTNAASLNLTVKDADKALLDTVIHALENAGNRSYSQCGNQPSVPSGFLMLSEHIKQRAGSSI